MPTHDQGPLYSCRRPTFRRLSSVVPEFIHQLDASDLCIQDRRLCSSNGRQGLVPDWSW
jgi:hypothetical protein